MSPTFFKLEFQRRLFPTVEVSKSGDEMKMRRTRQTGYLVLAVVLGVFLTAIPVVGQQYGPVQNNVARQNAFRQEIAKLNITVERSEGIPLPIKMVPRVRRGDVIRIRLIDQPINGIRPKESLWDWSLAVAFVNPGRNEAGAGSVSREINFRRDGWYREHSVKAPYDSQPIFFLYTRQGYRKKIRKLISRNFNEVRKIGEKTIEIADAYAQIGSFLNQLQGVIRQNPNVFNNNNSSVYGGYYNYGNSYGDDFMREQLVERLAQSFNIALPNCWKRGFGNYSNYSNDFVSRAQCVARSVRIEDFDLSVSKILQQGGILAAAQLAKKYPALAHWINIAAIAADLILRVTRKTPLRVYPTIATVRNSNHAYNRPDNYLLTRQGQRNQRNRLDIVPPQQLSIYSNQSPSASSFVSAFPIVVHKWQAEPDPKVITLPIPRLLEPCLHIGRNILKNTDLSYDWLRDPYARDFRLVLSSENGFTKEFSLTKNMGISGWDLMVNPGDVNFPKVKMTLKAQVVATRGFNKIRSPKFEIPMPGGGNWAVKEESKKGFSVGGKRRVVITNTNGNCGCISSVKYKPSFGGEFEFATRANANPIRISEDGSYAWFDIDTSHFKPGNGNLEVYTFGSAGPEVIPITLYGPPPKIAKLNVHRGDRHVTLEGKGVEQIRALKINGKLAFRSQEPGSAKQTAAIFTFRDPGHQILSKKVKVELELEGNRRHILQKLFPVLPARPTLAAANNGEIEADVLDGPSANGGKHKGFDLSPYPVAFINTKKMTLAVKTSLTDYEFRAENISIETRIENGAVGQAQLPETAFEVIDTFNMRIDFTFNSQYNQFLAGRRLQFRVRDRVRGVSDWYTIKQTFIRIPQITSIRCSNGKCRIVGKGLDYIGQYSVDGGATWQAVPEVRATATGNYFLVIPEIRDKKLLQIKLRDFPATRGLPVVK